MKRFLLPVLFLTAAFPVFGDYAETLKSEFTEILSVLEQNSMTKLPEDQARKDLIRLFTVRGIRFADQAPVPPDLQKASVKVEKISGGKFLLAKTDAVVPEYAEQIRKEKDGTSGTILDLRNCSAGKKEDAVKLAELFREEKNPVLILISGKTAGTAEFAVQKIGETVCCMKLGTPTAGVPEIVQAVPLKNGGFLLIPDSDMPAVPIQPDLFLNTSQNDSVLERAENLLTALECMKGNSEK